MSTVDTILIRADADTRMGAGHVLRCLALAQEWQGERAQVVFALGRSSEALLTRLRCEGMSVARVHATPGSCTDATETIELARHYHAGGVVIDGYQFDGQYLRRLQRAVRPSLLVTDLPWTEPCCADLVLNSSPQAHAGMYAVRAPHTQLLLGLDYVPLRREFRARRERQREVPAVARRVLVTIGGGDADNLTLRVLTALARLPMTDLEVRVVLGTNNPHYDTVAKACAACSFKTSVEQSATDMAALMTWADVAISASGGTCWELAIMGVPAVVFAVAENQEPIAAALVARGVVENPGPPDVCETVLPQVLAALLNDPLRRAEMSRRGREMIDGRGAERVVAAWRAHPAAPALEV